MKWFKILYIVLSWILTLPAQNQTTDLKSEALQNIKLGLFGEAIDQLNKFISANPQDVTGYHLRGMCYEKRSQFDLAVYDYKSALKLNPKNQEIKKDLSRTTDLWYSILYNKIIGYQREIAINPLTPINYLEIGKCYKNLGEWEKAESWYDEYLKREEASADEILRYTEILAKTNHLTKGERILKSYSEKYPADHRLWSRYGYFTMWLGKKIEATDAFETALKLRPFFQEALDGYDLVRGKGFVYTVNDTTVRYNYGLPVKGTKKEFLIDSYFKKLLNNPSDIETRIKLIDELVKYNRFEEAAEQLKILDKDSSEDNYKTLKSEVYEKRKNYYSSRINELEAKVKTNQADSKDILTLSDYLYKSNRDDEAINLLQNFLINNPLDKKAKYKLAELLAWNGQFDESSTLLYELILDEPGNNDYNLLYGKVGVWKGEYSQNIENALKLVLNNQPENFDAIYTLANFYYQENMLIESVRYLEKAYMLQPDNLDLLKLEFLINNKRKQNKIEDGFKILTKARELVVQKKCDEAINIYTALLSDSSYKELKLELAEAYLCKNDFKSALNIYDELIFYEKNNYELRKKRAKIIFWSSNYAAALNDLLSLNELDEADAEIKLMIADSYFYLKDYTRARNWYNNLLAIAPDSYIIQQRLKWFGPDSSSDFSFSGFPAYNLLSPEANYFSDNFDFTYSTYGVKYEIGLNRIFSVGVGGYGGLLTNDSINTNLSIFKGFAVSRFANNISLSVSGGVTNFNSSRKRFNGEVILQGAEKKLYNFYAGFYISDAAQVLYSPFLVDQRLIARLADIGGFYVVNKNWKFNGRFSYFLISDKNRGNRLQLQLGKFFTKELAAGYEYYIYSFKDHKIIYWSPENYDAHSLWAEWKIAESEIINASLIGKVGYLPADKFVLREFNGSVYYKIAQNFSLQGSAGFSTTIQSARGYSSTSFSVSAFWNF